MAIYRISAYDTRGERTTVETEADSESTAFGNVAAMGLKPEAVRVVHSQRLTTSRILSDPGDEVAREGVYAAFLTPRLAPVLFRATVVFVVLVTACAGYLLAATSWSPFLAAPGFSWAGLATGLALGGSGGFVLLVFVRIVSEIAVLLLRLDQGLAGGAKTDVDTERPSAPIRRPDP